MKQLSDIDIRISWAQAWNLSVASCGTINTWTETWVKDIEKRQEYFYDKLTRGYIEKFSPQNIPQGKSKVELKEIVADEFGSDAENLI